jgi:hypothetical protein
VNCIRYKQHAVDAPKDCFYTHLALAYCTYLLHFSAKSNKEAAFVQSIRQSIPIAYSVFSFLHPAHNLTTLTNNNNKTSIVFKEDKI